MFDVPPFPLHFSPSSLRAFVVNLFPMSAEQQEPKERKTLDDRATPSNVEASGRLIFGDFGF